MSPKRITIIRLVSLFAGALITLQIFLTLVMGDAFCLNDGCRIVEKLTIIPPLAINLAGLFYFIVLFIASSRSKKESRTGPDLTRLLLLLGLGVEGVLFSYQIFVIQTFCSYCLVILAIIVVLNLLCGWQQIRLSLPLFGVVIASFAILNFSPASLFALRSETLAAGTYAVKKCADPAKKHYFFFSADCPHCKNVITAMENCSSCEFHFNPIDKNQNLAMAGLEYSQSYNPSLNRIILSLLNISTIPVLLVQDENGLTFIKGKNSIINFISKACSAKQQEITGESSPYDDPGGMNTYTEPEGECTIEVECPDITEPAQSPYVP